MYLISSGGREKYNISKNKSTSLTSRYNIPVQIKIVAIKEQQSEISKENIEYLDFRSFCVNVRYIIHLLENNIIYKV